MVIKSECKPSVIEGKASSTIVLSKAPINVPRITMNRMMFWLFTIALIHLKNLLFTFSPNYFNSQRFCIDPTSLLSFDCEAATLLRHFSSATYLKLTME